MTIERTRSAIREVFADAGVRGWLHARAVHDPAVEVGYDADELVPLASVYKVIILATFARAVDSGEIDPRGYTTLQPRRRTAGPTGIAALRDAVTVSWRDAVTSMITVSDNAAADAVVSALGRLRIAQTIEALELDRTTVMDDSRGQVRGLLRDTGTTTETDAYRVLADPDRALEPAGYDPVRTSASTPRQLTRLLSALWSDTAASPAQCAFARDTLSATFGPYRLRTGFALDGIALSHKTGTLGALRHDVGVVRFADERPYAVAVLTRSARPDRILPRADAAIGAAGRLAVDHLRLVRPGWTGSHG
jgi:beta-lactamase class A